MKRTDKLYAITALYDTPDEIMHAAEKTANAGYQKFDVHTPYPVHGMDDAMKLPPSKLGLITLIMGLSGAAFALSFMYWVMSVAYPMVIGGKPFFALPAFIPITFEVTVLLATVTTVLGMIALFFKFPSNSHPLHESDYMRAVSKDKYGVCIEAKDEKFTIEDVKAFLESTNPKNIIEIYEYEQVQYKLLEPKFLLVLIGVAIVVSVGTYGLLNKAMFISPFSWMMEQPKIIPQEKVKFFADGFGNRPPVEGTVKQGFLPYDGEKDKQPEHPLVNPLLPTEKNLTLGKEKYHIYCSACHGMLAEGESRLRGQFPKPPSLHASKSLEWKDGNFFHVIMTGQNVMPSYKLQITRETAWAIVTYIRALQKSQNATESEIQEIKEESVANVE